MATVKFPIVVKYEGVRYPARTEFECKDEDLPELKAAGAWVVDKDVKSAPKTPEAPPTPPEAPEAPPEAPPAEAVTPTGDADAGQPPVVEGGGPGETEAPETDASASASPPEEPESELSERDALRAKLDKAGIEYSNRYGIPRLEALLAEGKD